MLCMKTGFMLLAICVAQSGLSAQSAPVPQPFPGAGSSQGTAPARAGEVTSGGPAVPAALPAALPAQDVTSQALPPQAPTAPVATPAPPPPPGVPVYPTADYLATYDAGQGQEFILYGSNLSYADIVTYYKRALKNNGTEVFRSPMPPTHQFTLGRYVEQRMAFPPSVVVKDYTWNNSPGYLHVAGATEKRYKTIIQIVAPGPGQ